MDIVALTVAILSALAAAGSVVYSRRSANAATRAADASESSAQAVQKSVWLESEADWRARTPSFAMEWEEVIEKQGNSILYGATLQSRGPERYGSVHLRLLRPPVGEDQILVALVDLRDYRVGSHVELGPIDVGQRLKFGVQPEFDEDGYRRGGIVDLQLTARTVGEGIDVDEWTILVRLEIPQPPRVLAATD